MMIGYFGLLVLLFIFGVLYSVFLHSIKEHYIRHNLTWLTVVVGDGFIWIVSLYAAWSGITTTSMGAVWFHLFGLFAAGGPVIMWRLWDGFVSERFVLERKRGRHGSTNTERG